MAAQYHGLVTYQVIAKMMGLPSSGNYMAHELGIILGEISEDEVRKGRPMLSAMAVGVSGEPGEGFYTLAKELGLLQDDSPEEKRQFWEEQKARVYETWRAE
ncbi:MAG: hypothetical protein JW963_11560 [Anaerolineales bacterium]|nr:hypothetical protein [Anaerolineales bacterium]